MHLLSGLVISVYHVLAQFHGGFTVNSHGMLLFFSFADS